MMQAWSKLTRRVAWKNAVTGWCRTLEITRGKDGNAHPHFHAIIQVSPSYFEKESPLYISHTDFMKTWRDCLCVDYDPRVDIRAITRGKMAGAIAETSKYLAKGYDVDGLNDQDFKAYVNAINGVRVWGCGGNFKITEEEVEEELLHADDEEKHETCNRCGGELLETQEIWDTVAGKYVYDDESRYNLNGYASSGINVTNIYVKGDFFIDSKKTETCARYTG